MPYNEPAEQLPAVPSHCCNLAFDESARVAEGLGYLPSTGDCILLNDVELTWNVKRVGKQGRYEELKWPQDDSESSML